MHDYTTQTGTDDQRVDGRTARRDRNKLAVLDVVIELFSEGNYRPGVHEVAERSGVSLRSVYRYFDDGDDLVAAATNRHLQRVRPLFRIPDIGVGTTHDRIERFCHHRMRLFSTTRSIYLAGRIRALDQDAIAREMDRNRAQLSEQTKRMFAPELDQLDPDRAEAIGGIIDALSQFDTLEHIFGDHDQDVTAATAFLIDAFREILG